MKEVGFAIYVGSSTSIDCTSPAPHPPGTKTVLVIDGIEY
jgi:hypothetical protein